MAFNRPSLQELIDRAHADTVQRLTGEQVPLRRSVLRVLTRVFAAIVHNLYGHLSWLAVQVVPNARMDTQFLERNAALHGITRRAPATASGQINVTGLPTTLLPAGTIWHNVDGLEYQTQQQAVLNESGAALVLVQAMEPGDEYNEAVGRTLSIAETVTGITSTALVVEPGISGGRPLGTDADLLADLLQHLRLPPHGGAAHDYVAWARQAHSAVTRVWPDPLALGANTVTIRLVTDGQPDGISPSPEVIEAVKNYIEPRRPVTTQVYVVGPLLRPLDMTLRLRPDTTELRQLVEQAIADLILTEAAPGEPLLISHVREAISKSAGEHDHQILSHTDDIPADPYELLVPGTIQFQTS
jgi:uncharacterized phage protein gp47/JayE